MGKKIKIRDKIILSLFCIVLGGVFVAIGVYVWYRQLTPYFQVRQSISWQPVQATLLDAKVIDDWSEPGRTKRGGIKYFIDIRYQYSFKNKNYTGTRYSFYNFCNNAADGGKLHSFVKNNPPGTKICCFVNPENPTEAVVSREKRNPLPIILLSIPCFIVGLYFVFVKSRVFSLPAHWKESQDGKVIDK